MTDMCVISVHQPFGCPKQQPCFSNAWITFHGLLLCFAISLLICMNGQWISLRIMPPFFLILQFNRPLSLGLLAENCCQCDLYQSKDFCQRTGPVFYHSHFNSTAQQSPPRPLSGDVVISQHLNTEAYAFCFFVLTCCNFNQHYWRER